MAAARGGGELWEAGKFWTLKKGEVLLDLTQLCLLHPDVPSPSPRQHGRGDHHPTLPPCLNPATVALCLDWSQRADARPARDSSVTLGGSVSLSACFLICAMETPVPHLNNIAVGGEDTLPLEN